MVKGGVFCCPVVVWLLMKTSRAPELQRDHGNAQPRSEDAPGGSSDLHTRVMCARQEPTDQRHHGGLSS